MKTTERTLPDQTPIANLREYLVRALVSLLCLVVAGPSAALTYNFTTASGGYGTFSWDPETVGGGIAVSGYELGVVSEWWPVDPADWSFALFSGDDTPLLAGPLVGYPYFDLFASRGDPSAYPPMPDPLVDDLTWYLENASGSFAFGFSGSLCPGGYGASNGDPLPSCVTHLDFEQATGAFIDGEVITSWSALPEPTTAVLFGIGLAGLLAVRAR